MGRLSYPGKSLGVLGGETGLSNRQNGATPPDRRDACPTDRVRLKPDATYGDRTGPVRVPDPIFH
jgi:hypothetical protein